MGFTLTILMYVEPTDGTEELLTARGTNLYRSRFGKSESEVLLRNHFLWC